MRALLALIFSRARQHRVLAVDDEAPDGPVDDHAGLPENWAQSTVGDLEVELGVDVDALELVHDEQADPTPDPVVELVVDPGAGQVQRPGLAVAQRRGGEVLAPRAGGDVVGGGGPGIRAVSPALGPDERRLRHHPHERVDAGRVELRDGARQRAGQPDRGGGLQQHHGVRCGVGRPGRGDGVAHHRLGGRRVERELGRAQEGDERAGRAGHGGDLLVVGRHDHVHGGAGREGLLEGPDQQRLAADEAQVLAGHALGPATGRDDAEDPHAAIIPRTTSATARDGSTSGRSGDAVGGPPQRARS